MDNSLLRWINRLANRTGWAHGFFTAYAKYGIVLFAVLLIVAYLDSRQHDDLSGVAVTVSAAGVVLVALGIGQLIGGAIDRARPTKPFLESICSSTRQPTSRSPATTPPPPEPSPRPCTRSV